MARSRLGKLIRSSVSSAPREGSSLFTAAAIRSFSDVGATEPAGDSVLGGVDSVAGIDSGVEGWSGADAVALGAFGSREIDCESPCDAAGDGEGDFDFAGVEALEGRKVFLTDWICSFNFAGS